MKVTHATQWQVKMGRQGDFLNVNRRAAEIHKRLGASEIKVLAALAGTAEPDLRDGLDDEAGSLTRWSQGHGRRMARAMQNRC